MKMTIDEAIQEWQSKNRHMGCVSATNWFCKRVKGFYPERLPRYSKEGDYFEHVIATNGFIRIDLSPYADKLREKKIKLERKMFWDKMLR